MSPANSLRNWLSWFGALVVLKLAPFVLAFLGADALFEGWSLRTVVGVTLIALGMAAWVATPDVLAYCERVRLVLSRLGILEKEAAWRVGISQSLFSEWLSGAKRIEPLRLRRIGPEFNAEMAATELEDAGFTVIRGGELSALVSEIRALRADRISA